MELHSTYQLTLMTSSCSLSTSFTSQSSSAKVSADFNQKDRKPKPKNQSQIKTNQTSQSSDSDGSFFILETVDSESFGSAHDLKPQKHASRQEIRESSLPQHLQGCEDEQGSAKLRPAQPLMSCNPNPQMCASTEASTESSYEWLVENQSEHQARDCNPIERVSVPGMENSFCFNCKYGTFADTVDNRQYWLSQQDYKALLAGVCHGCLLRRLHNGKLQFSLEKFHTAYSK